MELIQGDFADAKYKVNLWCATTCAVKDKRGHLVMGKGTAQYMKWCYPHIPRIFGEMLTTPCYGLMVHYPSRAYLPSVVNYGAFQTKYDWRQKSDLDLIKFSVLKLMEWLLAYPTAIVAIPFPGINNGGLSREEVLPIISLLPNNVKVYEKCLSL